MGNPLISYAGMAPGVGVVSEKSQAEKSGDSVVIVAPPIPEGGAGREAEAQADADGVVLQPHRLSLVAGVVRRQGLGRGKPPPWFIGQRPVSGNDDCHTGINDGGTGDKPKNGHLLDGRQLEEDVVVDLPT